MRTEIRCQKSGLPLYDGAPMRIALVPVLLSVTFFSASIVSGEDVQLRNQAVGLMNRAQIVSKVQGGPYNFRTEATFTATAGDGSLQSGNYTRVRGNDGALREDLRFGDYAASSITQDALPGWTSNWNDPPYAARKIRELVPYRTQSFDSSDVIEQISSASYGGREGYCIEFETIVGEQRLPGEVCVDKANGSMLEVRTGSKLWEYSDYFTVKGALMPAHIVYRESSFSMNADMTMKALEEKPEEAFVVPEDWMHGFACKQGSLPVAKSAPQPRGEGGPGALVTDINVHLLVSAKGTVLNAEVVKPVRDDLDKEAQKLASTWVFEPGTCNGHAQDFKIDVTIHFQGR
jgi:TonB family protein